jgi:hypothetical protein
MLKYTTLHEKEEKQEEEEGKMKYTCIFILAGKIFAVFLFFLPAAGSSSLSSFSTGGTFAEKVVQVKHSFNYFQKP